jgi:hypothetical protein
VAKHVADILKTPRFQTTVNIVFKFVILKISSRYETLQKCVLKVRRGTNLEMKKT